MDFLLPEEKQAAPDFQFATVATVTDTGVTLLFDGESEAGTKVYKTAAGVVLHNGDRVKVCRDSGTVVVEYAIGVPGSSPAEVHGIPAGGTIKQVLTKSSNADYDTNWTDQPVGVPDGGAENQMLTADNSGAPVWSTIRFRVASGFSGKIEYSIDGTTWKTVATE